MIKEFELKKVNESEVWIQFEVKRKGLYYGLLTLEKSEVGVTKKYQTLKLR